MSTVLITGASRGIGRATAKAFANSGWDLLLISRSEDDLESLINEIENEKIKVYYKSIDLNNPNLFSSNRSLKQKASGEWIRERGFVS